MHDARLREDEVLRVLASDERRELQREYDGWRAQRDEAEAEMHDLRAYATDRGWSLA